MEQATCSRCGTAKSLEEFAIDRSKRIGRKPWCKACDNARSRDYYRRTYEPRTQTYIARCEACCRSFVASQAEQRYCTDGCQRRAYNAQYNSEVAWEKLLAGRIGDVDTGSYHRALSRDPCAYCGGTHEHLDHIVPSRRGGENQWINLTSACGPCNSGKGGNTLLSFLARRSLLADRVVLNEQLKDWQALQRPLILERKPRTPGRGGQRSALRRRGEQ